MNFEQQLLDKIEELIKAFKEDGQTTAPKTKSESIQNSDFGSDYRVDRIKEYKQQISEINRETQEITKNIFSYETVFKRLNRLAKEKDRIESELRKKGLTELERTKLILQYNQKVNEIEKERAKAQREGYTKLDEFNDKLEKRTEALKKGFGEIKKGFEDIVNVVKKLTEPWTKIDQASADYAKNVGMSLRGMETLRKTTMNTHDAYKIGANFNVSNDELLKLRQQVVNSIGRNVTISSYGQADLAAMSKLFGNEGASEFVSKLENFGLSTTEAGNRATRIWKEASKFGISADKLSKNFLSNIKKAQDYSFTNGLKGLEAMAKRATELKLDMSQAFSFADKVSTVEGAITTAAGLQVLGGPFTQFSDAIAMLQEGLTDPAKLQERLVNMVGGLGILNRQTGEVDVSAFNKRRIKAAADAAGLDYSNVMEMVYANTRGSAIAEQAKQNSLFANNEEWLNLIRNVGTFQNGQAGAYLERNGQLEFVKTSEMTEKDIRELVSINKNDSENIQDIAKSLRGMEEVISGRKKQQENTQAMMIEKSGVGKRVKNIYDFMSQNNALLKAIAASTIAMAAVTVAGGAWTMFRGGVRSIQGIRNLFRNTARASLPGGGANFGQIVGIAPQGSTVTRTSTPFNPSGPGPNGRPMPKVNGRMVKANRIGGGAGAAAAIAGGILSSVIPQQKAGSTADFFAQVLPLMLEYGGAGATLGSIVGGGIGSVPASVIGAILGGVGGIVHGSINYTKNKRYGQINELGLGLNGSYTANELKHIRESVKGNEQLSAKLVEKMKMHGDYEKFTELNTKADSAKVNVQGPVSIYSSGIESLNNQHFSNGGVVSGPGGVDNVPIWASRGEFIMSNNAVSMWGVDRLSAMNQYANTHNSMYANGGLIKPWKGYSKGTNGESASLLYSGGGHGGTRGSDRIKIDPIKLDISGTIKLDLGGQTADITAKKLLENDKFTRSLSKLIQTEIRRQWNGGSNPVVRGADNLV